MIEFARIKEILSDAESCARLTEWSVYSWGGRRSVMKAVTACGAGSSGRGRKTTAKLPAVKQEPTHGIFVHA